jgi:hypothetical protein
MKTWSGHMFFEMVTFVLKWTKLKNGRKSNPNLPWTAICNQWISRYIT